MASINKRVIKDIKEGYENLKNECGILIAAEDENMYNVHFILPGPEDTVFEGGLYHGMIRLNQDHPNRPPNIHMITPSGRFIAEPYPIPNGSRGICTTTSSFHPENWTPINNIETVIKGFLSLMCDLTDQGIGGMMATNDQIKQFAKKSIEHIKSEPAIKKLFPELYASLINGTYKQPKLSNLGKNKLKNVNIITKKENKPVAKKNKQLDSESDSTESDEPPAKRKSITNKKADVTKIKKKSINKYSSPSESESESDTSGTDSDSSSECDEIFEKIANKKKTTAKPSVSKKSVTKKSATKKSVTKKASSRK